MTVDPAARAELFRYADELDREADAAGEVVAPPPGATGSPDGRRDLG